MLVYHTLLQFSTIFSFTFPKKSQKYEFNFPYISYIIEGNKYKGCVMGLSILPKVNMLSDMQLAYFCQQLSMIVKAGLPFHYGISLLQDESTDDHVNTILGSIVAPLEAGSTLSAALADTPSFPSYMIQMIRLGEQTGRLEDALDSLSAYYEREAMIRSGIRRAFFYPTMMTFLMIIVLAIVVSKIIPVFASVYTTLVGELEGATLFLMNISTFLNRHALLLTITLIVLAIIAFTFYQTALGKALFQGKGLSMSIATSRFANCMYLALSSGLDVDHSLKLSKQLVDNPYMQEKIEKCEAHIQHGESFVTALTHSGIFSKIYSGLLVIGAKTGSMVPVMKKICDAYEENTDNQIHRLINILEPTLVIILSLFIGLILFSYILPLIQAIVIIL